MTKFEPAILQGEIEKELKELEKLREEMAQILLSGDPSSVEVRAAGSVLHDFYCGAEKIFKKVAARIDQDVPAGDDWHIQLIERMAIAVPGLRPAVISAELQDSLSEYLRFRHLFRNLYGFELRWSRLRELGVGLEKVLALFTKDIEEFMIFLRDMQENL